MKLIGRLKTKSSNEIKSSRVGIGFECYDRDLFDPDFLSLLAVTLFLHTAHHGAVILLTVLRLTHGSTVLHGSILVDDVGQVSKKISFIRNILCGVSQSGKISIKQSFYFFYGSFCNFIGLWIIPRINGINFSRSQFFI